MLRYSSAGTSNSGQGAIDEFKFLVKEAHKRGMEVIDDLLKHCFHLDVSRNFTLNFICVGDHGCGFQSHG